MAEFTGDDGNNTISGTEGADTLLGMGGDDVLAGLGGDDSLDGGAGFDIVDYSLAAALVVVDIGAGSASGGAGNDTLVGIEGVIGSDFTDTLTGDDNNNFFRGRLGDDAIDGRGGTDRAVYDQATGAVVVSLLAGTASGADGSDTLLNIENLRGSAFADTLTGNDGANDIQARDGNDTVHGGGGNDVLLGEVGDDTLNGDAGDDYADGGAGSDQLFGGAGGDTLRGGLGDDTLDGGTQGTGQADFADYRAAAGAVVVDLVAGTASGADGNDVLIGIEAVFGSAYDDHFTGTALLDYEYFRGGLGNDVIDGGAGFDIADYGSASASVVIDLVTGTTSGADGADTLIGIEGISGGAFADTLLGAAGNDWLRGRAGDDSIDGGAGFDRAIYEQASSAVTVDLAAGTASGGDGSDTLVSIENLRGSNFADTLSGDDGANDIEARGGNDIVRGLGGNDTLRGEAGDDQLYGGDGNDVLAGGAGDDLLDGGGQAVGFVDIANYTGASAGVTANLATGTGGGASEGTDTYVAIEGLLGSHFDDILIGDAATNYFRGNRGNDLIDGGGGTADDYTNARNDIGDAADYRDATGSVAVNLATGTASGADGTDILIDIEHVTGSAHADTLTGDAGNNLLRGRGGDDLIDGGAGIDRADYRNATGAVTASLNDDGSGSSSGADGNDTLAGIENLQGSELYGDSLSGNVHANWLRGLGGDDTIDGGAGIDTAGYEVVLRADSTLARTAGGWTVSSLVEGTDTLSDIERLEFADGHLALDLDGHAGSVARILRALFGPAALDNELYAGIGLGMLDAGMAYDDLVALAMTTQEFRSSVGSGSNAEFVARVYENVVGVAPSAAEQAEFTALLDFGFFTQESLAVYACAESVELVGLADTGRAYECWAGGALRRVAVLRRRVPAGPAGPALAALVAGPAPAAAGRAARRRCGASAAASSSWKLSRTHWANTSGSGISSRHEVGEMISRPSWLVTANTSPMPSAMGMMAEK